MATKSVTMELKNLCVNCFTVENIINLRPKTTKELRQVEL